MKVFSIIFLGLCLMACSGSKGFGKKLKCPEADIAYSQKWFGGVKGSSGTNFGFAYLKWNPADSLQCDEIWIGKRRYVPRVTQVKDTLWVKAALSKKSHGDHVHWNPNESPDAPSYAGAARLRWVRGKTDTCYSIIPELQHKDPIHYP